MPQLSIFLAFILLMSVHTIMKRLTTPRKVVLPTPRKRYGSKVRRSRRRH